jgi:hypothetical protein
VAAAAEPRLTELEGVPWRARASAESLRAWGRLWTFWTVLSTAPFLAAAVVLFILEPLSLPVGLACVAHAWIIPELYAYRGSNVVRARGAREGGAERNAQGLLGDLLDHEPRELHRATGLAMEHGSLGVWLIGEAGALLVPPGGRRVHCFCVGTRERELPPSDRIAHLLLALRTDEEGFATVANRAFSGAVWRLRRRLPREQRPALAAAREAARTKRRGLRTADTDPTARSVA